MVELAGDLGRSNAVVILTGVEVCIVSLSSVRSPSLGSSETTLVIVSVPLTIVVDVMVVTVVDASAAEPDSTGRECAVDAKAILMKRRPRKAKTLEITMTLDCK